jgi:hypothetical protein
VTVTRLVGGLTPGDGSDPRTFPAIWNSTADVIDAQDSAISAIESDLLPTSIGTAVAGQKLVFDGTNWVNLTGYVFVETVYFTSSGTFSKADYPWLRAIRVRCQGAGGGGGAAPATAAGEYAIGGGGGSGGYSESFITDIAGLASSVTVTRGAGGAGGVGATAPAAGGVSSFGSAVVANGGGGAGNGFAQTPSFPTVTGSATGGAGAVAGTGDLVLAGGGGFDPTFNNIFGNVFSTLGASSFLSGVRGAVASTTGANGANGLLFGGGATGGVNNPSQATARTGGNGGNGIVIVELFA